jgi:hypothetical protein
MNIILLHITNISIVYRISYTSQSFNPITINKYASIYKTINIKKYKILKGNIYSYMHNCDIIYNGNQ